MERTSKSITYEAAEPKVHELLRERAFRDLWLFEYACRHVEERLRHEADEEDRDSVMRGIYDLFERHIGISDDEREQFQQFLEFGYGLAYAFHRRTKADGFLDLSGEFQLSKFKYLLETITANELSVVRRLHELSCQHGFLITDLWAGPTDMVDFALCFIRSYPGDPKVPLPIPRFSFPKNGKHIKGIQISVPPYDSLIHDKWDLVIYFNEKQKISHIKSSIDTAWNTEGIQAIGDTESHQIAIYIDRNSCTKSHALSALELQIDSLIFYTGRSREAGIKNPVSSFIDQLRISEDFLSKRWSVGKNNVRRAIGLYLWDQINRPNPCKKNRKAAINDCIDILKEENPEVVEAYFSNFNCVTSPNKTEKFGDLAKHHQTVVREMEADYDLTVYCIEKGDYYRPTDVKNKK